MFCDAYFFWLLYQKFSIFFEGQIKFHMWTYSTETSSLFFIKKKLYIVYQLSFLFIFMEFKISLLGLQLGWAKNFEGLVTLFQVVKSKEAGASEDDPFSGELPYCANQKTLYFLRSGLNNKKNTPIVTFIFIFWGGGAGEGTRTFKKIVY